MIHALCESNLPDPHRPHDPLNRSFPLPHAECGRVVVRRGRDLLPRHHPSSPALRGAGGALLPLCIPRRPMATHALRVWLEERSRNQSTIRARRHAAAFSPCARGADHGCDATHTPHAFIVPSTQPPFPTPRDPPRFHPHALTSPNGGVAQEARELARQLAEEKRRVEAARNARD